MDKEFRTQLIAMALIGTACISISLGSARGWHDLVTFALTFGGAGVGILTGQRLSASTKEGDVNVNPTQ
jgi:hypothetical protein